MKNQTDRNKAFAKLAAHPIRITSANEARLAAVIRREERGATLWTITPHDLARMVEAGEAELDRLKLPKALRGGAEIHREPPERLWGQDYGGGTFCKIVRGSRHWGLAWIDYCWQQPALNRHPRTETVTVVLSLAQQRHLLDSNPQMGYLAAYLRNMERERADYERENDLLGVCVSDLRNDLRKADLLNEALRSELAKADELSALTLNGGTI